MPCNISWSNFLFDSFNQNDQYVLLPNSFHISFVQLQSQLDELEEHLMDCQHQKQMEDFLESNILEQYLSNVLWPKQIISIQMIFVHSFNYVS